MTVSQIGRRLGIGKPEAEQLTARPGFPAPVGEVTASTPPYSSAPLWRWRDVQRYACLPVPAAA